MRGSQYQEGEKGPDLCKDFPSSTSEVVFRIELD